MIINAHLVVAHLIDDDRPVRAFVDRSDADAFADAANARARAIDAWRCVACGGPSHHHDPHQGAPECSAPSPLNEHDPEMFWPSTKYRVQPLPIQKADDKWLSFNEEDRSQ